MRKKKQDENANRKNTLSEKNTSKQSSFSTLSVIFRPFHRVSKESALPPKADAKICQSIVERLWHHLYEVIMYLTENSVIKLFI